MDESGRKSDSESCMNGFPRFRIRNYTGMPRNTVSNDIRFCEPHSSWLNSDYALSVIWNKHYGNRDAG